MKPIINTKKQVADEMSELERETWSESMNLILSSKDVSEWTNKKDKKVSDCHVRRLKCKRAVSKQNRDLDLDCYLPFFVNKVPESMPVGRNQWLSITFEAAGRALIKNKNTSWGKICFVVFC